MGKPRKPNRAPSTAWQDDALCAEVGPAVFFPDDRDNAAAATAKAMCAGCPVVAECLTWAIDTRQDWGIWGGATAKERDRIRRRESMRARRRQAAEARRETTGGAA